jgi:hypothetical protein
VQLPVIHAVVPVPPEHAPVLALVALAPLPPVPLVVLLVVAVLAVLVVPVVPAAPAVPAPVAEVAVAVAVVYPSPKFVKELPQHLHANATLLHALTECVGLPLRVSIPLPPVLPF